MERVHTGSSILDDALDGGLRPGSALLVTGEEGAGATEFALTVLRATVSQKEPHRARFASALRSAARVAVEVDALFESDERASRIEVRVIEPAEAREEPTRALEGLGEGDVLVLESANTLALPGDGLSLAPLWHDLADAAQRLGVVVMMLHAPGTLPPAVEAALAQEADGVIRFTWHDSGPTRRRVLAIPKIRGLTSALDGDAIPVYEVALHRGSGFELSRGKSVL